MPDNMGLRAILASWRTAAASNQPPSEAAFVTADVNNYLSVLRDGFTLDVGPGGEFHFRFIGSALANYIGRDGARNRLAFGPAGTINDLVRRTVIQTVAVLSPHFALGRATDGGDTFEVICIPLIVASGSLAVFGAAARPGYDTLPPPVETWRVEIDALIDLETLQSDVGGTLVKRPPSEQD